LAEHSGASRSGFVRVSVLASTWCKSSHGHVTGVDDEGNKTIVSIPTENWNLGDMFGNFDNDSDDDED
jgi:hypothetical protein